jgi:hypothetical protein
MFMYTNICTVRHWTQNFLRNTTLTTLNGRQQTDIISAFTINIIIFSALFTAFNVLNHVLIGAWGARWLRGQCARRAIAEVKQRSQWSVMGWVTKIYYLELLSDSEGTLSRWFQLHLQSLVPTPVSRRVGVRQATNRKNNCQIFITPWWKSFCTDPT